MSQPVKLSDALVLDARVAGDAMQRSIAGQVEFWARMGRVVEQLLDGRHAMALARDGGAVPLSECLDAVDTPEGRARTIRFLDSQPFPHYEAHPVKPGVLIQIEADGTRSEGRFVNRRFCADAAVR